MTKSECRMTKEFPNPKSERHLQWFSCSGFVIRQSELLWCHALRLCLVGLLLPLADLVQMDAAQRQQFFFVINQFFSRRARERVIFHQENGFFGADFLAIAAKDAAQHVDLKLLG